MSSARPTAAPDAAQRSHGPRVAAVLACIFAFLAYVRAFGFGFVFDDHDQIRFNGAIQSWQHFGSLFTHHVWAFNDPNFGGNYWRPLFLVWLLKNHTLFGLQPMGWHIASALLHVAVTFLVYRVALRLTRDPWTAAFAALLFAVNPIHIEAVAWVSGATDPLMALFFLASLLCWFRYRDEKQPLWMAASLLFFAASMLSKETGIMMVAVVAAAVWFFAPAGVSAREKLRSTAVSVAPFAAVALLYFVCRLLVLRGMAHPLGGESWSATVLTWPAMLAFYARQLVVPIGLSGFYDVSVLESVGLLNFFVPLLVVAAIIAGLIVWTRRSRDPLVGFCAVWMLATILPVFYIRVFPPWDIVHDRYLYLPSVGFVLLLAVALRQIGNTNDSIVPRAQLVAVALIALVYLVSGIADQGIWSDDFNLYRRGFAVAPNNITPKVDLAIILIRNQQEGPRAAELLRQALVKVPNLWEANYNLGYLYFTSGANAEAENHLSRAIAIRPWEAPQFAYRSITRFRTGNFDGAADDARQALELTPTAKRYHYAYG
ncbi:MAG: glycosyltransferase family 39 protein, partial [Terriglobales bacterium]